VELSEIKEDLRKRPPEERTEISVYLKMLERMQDASYQAEMKKRAEDIRTGKAISGAALRELDQALRDQGL